MKASYLYFILIILVMSSCTKKQNVDTLYVNAQVYTVDHEFNQAEAFAVKDGKFVAVGSNEVLKSTLDASEIIDLNGSYVFPGLYDAHCHFYGYGNDLRNAQLMGTESWEQICDILVKHQKEHPSSWILGRGWDQNDWPLKEFPDRKSLDELFPDIPVYLKRIDGHGAICNSKALEIAGIDKNTEVDGGTVVIRKGRVTGMLVDNAMDLVEQKIPDPGSDEIGDFLMQAQENCFAVGLTSVADAGLSADIIDVIDSLQKEAKLKMRIYAMLSPGKENFERYMYKGIYKTDRLNVRSVKLFADGALGSRGALMLEPYSDDPDNTGLQVNSTEYLRSICAEAYEYGYQVCTHCIGDSANRLMLSLYAEQLKGENDRRWRIEHSQIIHPDDFDLFGSNNIIPSVQTTHCTSDMYWAELRVGEERIKAAYAYQQLLEQNGWLPNGSDFPVEYINPLFGFYSAFTRTDHEGWPAGGWQKENAISREDAMRAMTIWAAKAAFEEEEKGSIESGKFADFIVTKENLMTMDPSGIPGLKIQQTYIDGEKVFDIKDKN